MNGWLTANVLGSNRDWSPGHPYASSSVTSTFSNTFNPTPPIIILFVSDQITYEVRWLYFVFRKISNRIWLVSECSSHQVPKPS